MKKTQNLKTSIIYGVLCVALLAFIVAAGIGAYNEGSSLISDSVLLDAFSEYFDKVPRKVTQKDLDSVQYFAVNGDGTVSFGDKSIMESIDEGLSGDTAATVTLTGELKLEEAFGLMKNLQYIDIAAVSKELNSLDAITSYKNLRFLIANGLKVDSFDKLSELTALETLYLSDTEIKDGSFLKSLTNLTDLDISNTGMTDLSSIAELSKLKSLYADQNEGITLPSFEKLTALETLSLEENGLSDVSAVSACTTLKNLYLDNNKLTDISSLSNMEALSDLTLSDNELTGLDALSSEVH